MKVLLFITFTVLLVRWPGNAENASGIPQGLYDALYSVLNEGDYLKRNLQRRGFDTTIAISEIDPGIPVEYFHLKKDPKKDAIDQIIEIDDNAPVMSLVEPSGSWLFHVKARGKGVFSVNIVNENGKWVWAGTWGPSRAWEEVRAQYPESTGIKPVVIIGPTNRAYVHFPHINDHNLTWMVAKDSRDKIKHKLQSMNREKLNEMDVQELEDQARVLSNSYDSASIVDSKETLRYFKKVVVRSRERRAELEKRRGK